MIILNNQAEVSDVRLGNKAEFCFTDFLVVQYKSLDLQFPTLSISCQTLTESWIASFMYCLSIP